MVSNSPTFRAVIYCGAVAAQVAAYFVGAADASGAWADATQSTANFLGALAGVTALGNLTRSKDGHSDASS